MTGTQFTLLNPPRRSYLRSLMLPLPGEQVVLALLIFFRALGGFYFASVSILKRAMPIKSSACARASSFYEFTFRSAPRRDPAAPPSFPQSLHRSSSIFPEAR